MDDYLQSKTSVNSSASSAFSQQSTLINTGIFSEFDKTGVNYPIFWMIWFFQVS
jgi:hypothetical protein